MNWLSVRSWKLVACFAVLFALNFFSANKLVAFSLDDIVVGMGTFTGSSQGQLLVRDDPGLGPAPGSPPGGTNFASISDVAVLSNGNIVVAVNNHDAGNGQLFLRQPDATLSPVPGTPAGGVTFGPITSVAVMSNDNIVVGVDNGANGQVFVRDPFTLDPAPGTPVGGELFGPVVSVDVQSNDNVVVGVNNVINGQVFVRDPLLAPLHGLTGLGGVTGVAVNSLDQIAIVTDNRTLAGNPQNGQVLLREGSGNLDPVPGSPGGGVTLDPALSVAFQSDDEIAVGTIASLLLRDSIDLSPAAGSPASGTPFGFPVLSLAVQSDDDIAVGLDAGANGQLLLRDGTDLTPAAGSPGGGVVFSHAVRGLAAYPSLTPTTSFEWNVTGTGIWSNGTSWTPVGGPPNSAEDTAVFGGMISGATTAVVHAAVTVNRIELNNGTDSYQIAGSGSVNLAATGAGTDPTVEVLAGNHEFQVDVNLNGDTTVTVAGGSLLEFQNNIDLGGNDLTITGAGTVDLNTQITGSGNIINSGTVSTGLALGLSGDFDSTGTLDFDLTPNSAGQINAGGTATIDGSINVDFLDGETHTGDIALVTSTSPIVLPSGLPSLTVSGESGLSLALSGDSLSLLLVGGGVVNGDFNNDGVVNAADYSVWLDNLGGPESSINGAGDGSGTVDQADYAIWKSNFQAGQGAGSVAAVPEPSTLVMLLVVLATGLFRSKHG